MIIQTIPNKKMSPFHVPTILCVILISLFITVSHNHQTAYANTLSYDSSNYHNVKVTAWALNVRESGDISSKIINVVHRDDILNIIERKQHWDEIKLSNNQTGWVNNKYVTKAYEKTSVNTTATIESTVLNVRESPSLSSQVVGKLEAGMRITILKEQAGWAKIAPLSGVQGWVYENYISKNAESHQTANANSMHSTSFKSSQSMDTYINSKEQNTNEPLKGKTIVLDPGHGGKDNGTTSHYSGIHEKTLTLATAQDVEQKLKNAGANVIMTRTTDTFIPLQDRATLSNRSHTDAFISIHYNWSNDPSINGVIDFYYQEPKGNSLALDILSGVIKTTGLQNHGTRFDDLNVLRNNSQPCTLIELGFLSNKQDDMIVESSDYREKVAEGIYLGLINYFSHMDK